MSGGNGEGVMVLHYRDIRCRTGVDELGGRHAIATSEVTNPRIASRLPKEPGYVLGVESMRSAVELEADSSERAKTRNAHRW